MYSSVAVWILLINKCQALCFQAFDRVLTAPACVALDTACAAVSASGASHRIVDRGQLETVGPLSTVESCLNCALTELGDQSPFIEWWWRDEWRHLDMHRDLDEVLARETNAESSSMLIESSPNVKNKDSGLRCPTNGHVLYLDVGPEVQGGPTVLWDTHDVTEDDATSLGITSMAVVPAVRGRLLRFAGTTLHSVPRPPLAYLDSDCGGTGGAIHTRTIRKPGDDEFTLRRQSVLLFNTWSTRPEGFEVTEKGLAITDYDGSEGSATVRARTEWLDVAVRCPQELRGDSTGAGATARVKVGLLGDRRRRGTPERHWVGWARGPSAFEALNSKFEAAVVPISNSPEISD